jgi:ribosome modulation factor
MEVQYGSRAICLPSVDNSAMPVEKFKQMVIDGFVRAAFREGVEARQVGVQYTSCPYPRGDLLQRLGWLAGWRDEEFWFRRACAEVSMWIAAEEAGSSSIA